MSNKLKRAGQLPLVCAGVEITFSACPKTFGQRYTAVELNKQCDHTAPIPADLQSWEEMIDIGDEVLTKHDIVGI
jgi:hypothetical protein